MTASPHTTSLIAAVKAYALANYDKGEWGLIAEVYTGEEIGDLVDGATSEKEAINMVRRYLSPVTGPTASRPRVGRSA